LTLVYVFRLGTAEAEGAAGEASRAEVVQGNGGQANLVRFENYQPARPIFCFCYLKKQK